MSIEDGGPAFPLPVDDDRDCCFRFSSGYGGMTLRDYFAAKAMQGMLACQVHPASDEHMLSRDAYTVADAMIKARGKNGT
jgi:hypothetical protein